jgi:two-component system, chemotaxis family, sensor kinase CheA
MTGSSASVDSAMDRFRLTYFEECAELVETAYARLADLGEGRQDGDTLDALFRAIHSIKGGGGAFGFDRMVGFAHHLESLLDLVRSNKVEPSPDIVDLLTRALDVLSDLIASAKTGSIVEEGFESGVKNALQLAASPDGIPREQGATVTAQAACPGRTMRTVTIRFQPRAELYQRANEPQLLIRELQTLGQVKIIADLSRLPDIDVIDPEGAYIGWSLRLESDCSLDKVEEVFEFVSDDCELVIAEVSEPKASEKNPSTQNAPGPQEPKRRETDQPDSNKSIRVEVDRVDRVVNLVGELVINQSMLRQLGSEIPLDVAPCLIAGLDNLSQHLRELQESVMAMRAQPVKSVFSRMPRLVRELSAQLGKEARLVISGEGTEIDKTVVEQLSDPLTHLIRNSLDHGLETVADRLNAGKPRCGDIRLNAEHRSGRILIEVSDDGRGINRRKVRAKAEERGLVEPGAVMTDDEIDNLIFAPSLSTAESVSNISGRGVGMDVVKRNIQSLGGRISVDSKEGVGTKFTLSLPLTLAVLDGMVVAVGNETYLVPITVISESMRPPKELIHHVVGRGDVLAIRGEYLPLIYLHRLFGVPGAQEDPSKGIVIVVDAEGIGRVGLVVDELRGQQQVVVKSIETNYENVVGISGATILGNGRVAFILDVASLREAERAASERTGRQPKTESVQHMPRRQAAG